MSSNVTEICAHHAKARCGKTGKSFLHSWNCPSFDPAKLPSLTREDFMQGHHELHNRLTMCQRCLFVTVFLEASVWTQGAQETLCFDPHSNDALAPLAYRCGSPLGIQFARSFTLFDLTTSSGTPAYSTASHAIAMTRSSVSHHVTSLLLGDKVEWHSAVGWPREDIVAVDV